MRFVFFLLFLSANTHAQVIYKCAADGHITYSESPCKEGDYLNNRFAVRDDQLGNVVPDREAVQARRLRFQEEMNRQAATAAGANGVVVTNNVPSMRASDGIDRCVALEREIADIDAAARHGSSARRQDRLSERKRKVRQKQSELKC